MERKLQRQPVNEDDALNVMLRMQLLTDMYIDSQIDPDEYAASMSVVSSMKEVVDDRKPVDAWKQDSPRARLEMLRFRLPGNNNK